MRAPQVGVLQAGFLLHQINTGALRVRRRPLSRGAPLMPEMHCSNTRNRYVMVAECRRCPSIGTRESLSGQCGV